MSKLQKTAEILLAIYEDITRIDSVGKAFLFSMGSASILRKNMNMVDRQYWSSMQSLKRNGFIKKVNDNQFLVTPKGERRVKYELACRKPIQGKKWDGFLRLIVFDIPISKNNARDIFRCAIKRKGFIGIQKSTYVSADADFNDLIPLRKELGLEKYATFLMAKVADSENDSKLKVRLGVQAKML